jgi:hypothetical protein
MSKGLAIRRPVVTLTREQVASWGGALLPDNDQWTNRIQIRSETSSRLYTVAQNKRTGEWACSCTGWKRWRHCKHLDVMVERLRLA